MKYRDIKDQALTLLQGRYSTYLYQNLKIIVLFTLLTIIGLVFFIIPGLILSSFLSYSLVVVNLKLIDGEDVGLFSLWESQKIRNIIVAHLWRLLLGLLILLPFICLGYFLLKSYFFFVIILVAYGVELYFLLRTHFVYYILYEENISGFQALAKSFSITHGKTLELFRFYTHFLGWLFLVPFSLGILALWLVPYMQVATTLFYRANLKH